MVRIAIASSLSPDTPCCKEWKLFDQKVRSRLGMGEDCDRTFPFPQIYHVKRNGSSLTLRCDRLKWDKHLKHKVQKKMTSVSIELPTTAFSALRKNPDEFVKEMRIAAAVKWYELGQISQSKAAEIAGISRTDFINALFRYQVDFMQYTAEELAEEMANVD